MVYEMDEKLSVEIPVINDFGLHARPAAKLVEMAMKAKGAVLFSLGDIQADGKSIIDILTLGAMKGSSVTITLDNPLDESVLHEIVDFFEQGFGEI